MTENLLGADAAGAIGLLLLVLLLVVAVAIARLQNLFAIVILAGVYSLVSAAWYVLAGAVDVGFTEAAVGAGMSTVILFGAMLLTARTARPERMLRRIGPLLVCGVTGALLIYATAGLPPLGDPASPANTGPGLTYLQINWHDTGIANVVTSVLASYRGFDTLGETAVVFAGGLAVVLLLGFGERSLAQALKPGAGPASRKADPAP